MTGKSCSKIRELSWILVTFIFQCQWVGVFERRLVKHLNWKCWCHQEQGAKCTGWRHQMNKGLGNNQKCWCVHGGGTGGQPELHWWTRVWGPETGQKCWHHQWEGPRGQPELVKNPSGLAWPSELMEVLRWPRACCQVKGWKWSSVKVL